MQTAHLNALANMDMTAIKGIKNSVDLEQSDDVLKPL
jgi:hypothetical protein